MGNDDEKGPRVATDKRTLGENIEAIREARGLTQAQAAEFAGLSERNYVRWETGETKQPTAQGLKALADGLQTTVEILQGEAPFTFDLIGAKPEATVIKGDFGYVSALISTLGEEFRGDIQELRDAIGTPTADTTSLRAAVAAQSELIHELLTELRALRRGEEADLFSEGAEPQRRSTDADEK